MIQEEECLIFFIQEQTKNVKKINTMQYETFCFCPFKSGTGFNMFSSYEVVSWQIWGYKFYQPRIELEFVSCNSSSPLFSLKKWF